MYKLLIKKELSHIIDEILIGTTVKRLPCVFQKKRKKEIYSALKYLLNYGGIRYILKIWIDTLEVCNRIKYI